MIAKRLYLLVCVAATLPVGAVGGPDPAGGVHVETGLEAGGVVGVEGPTHSTVRAVSEIGYMWRDPRGAETAWGTGVTFYAGLGNDDMRLGIKPRVRYGFRPDWSIDVSAGIIFATLEDAENVSNTGFVGGTHLNHGDWFTFRLDVNVKRVGEWTTHHNNRPVIHEGGYETALYTGIALRNRTGWIATVVGVTGFLALMLLVLASGGAS